MRITILNGSQPDDQLNGYLEILSQQLAKNHKIEVFNLASMNLQQCIGCWSCWWKTPGLCAHNDDANDIFKNFVNTDFVIFASPIIAGFTSALLKKITDRLVVLLHPYIQIVEDECHHRKRYDKYPTFGLILKKEDKTDDEDIEIIRTIYDRFAINFHSKQLFLKTIDKTTVEEITNEIDNI